MNDGADAYGFSRDKENPQLRSKKYDVHADTRRRAYEAEQKEHHRKRMEKLKEGKAKGGPTMRSNNVSTFEDRRKAVLEKKERMRQEKIAKAKKSSNMVAKRLARKEAMEREKKLAGKEAYDVSRAGEGEVVELGSVKRGETSSECATCRGRENLEEDNDNRGVWYCKSCWEEWEGK